MVDRLQLLSHAPWQTMQHLGEADAVDRLEFNGDRREQIRLAQRVIAREPLRRSHRAMAVDIEERELLEHRSIGAVDKEAGAHARFEVVASEIVPVEVKQALREAMPGEAIGKAVNQTVVEGEHEGGVDGVRRRNRGSPRARRFLLSLFRPW